MRSKREVDGGGGVRGTKKGVGRKTGEGEGGGRGWEGGGDHALRYNTISYEGNTIIVHRNIDQIMNTTN